MTLKILKLSVLSLSLGVFVAVQAQLPSQNETTEVNAGVSTQPSIHIETPKTVSEPQEDLLTISFTPKQYSAEYESEYQGRKVKGTRSLIREDDHWVLQTKLKKLVIAIVEEATVTFEDKHVIPQRYEYRRSIFGKSKRQTLEYDYDQQQVHYRDEDEQGSYPLLPQSFDKSSQQFLIEEQLRRGKQYFSSNHSARNRTKQQAYQVLGEEYIELPIGVTKAIKVEIVPDPRNKRHTVMWFDPERHYLLVQLQQTDKHGKSYIMRLSDVKFLD